MYRFTSDFHHFEVIYWIVEKLPRGDAATERREGYLYDLIRFEKVLKEVWMRRTEDRSAAPSLLPPRYLVFEAVTLERAKKISEDTETTWGA